MKVKIKKLNENAVIPKYATENSAGADLYSCVQSDIVIQPNETVFIPTGISLEIPTGYAGFIYARSGLASRQGLAPANKVGVIDSDYRGEIIVALHNQSSMPQTVTDKMRIAQLVIAPYIQAQFDEVSTLDDTDRGVGGFGSTGTN